MHMVVILTRDGSILFVKAMTIYGVLNTQKVALLMVSCATLYGLLNFMMHYSVTLASYSQVIFSFQLIF